MAEISSIDDLLAGGGQSSTQPSTPESSYEAQDEAHVDYGEPEQERFADTAQELGDTQEETMVDPEEQSESDDASQETHTKEPELDEYGNHKAPPKTYTQEEVNEMFRKRFKNHPQEQQPTQQQVNQAAKDFEYDPESSDSWQAQLEKFVESTITKMSQRETQKQQQAREAQAQQEFEMKFTEGMGRFNDFREVVSAQPISDPMTYALRGMKDPAAFIYAASKRQPAELQRIANIPDPYAQMVEMGKLEERMRKAPVQTRAPKPVSRTRDDSALPIKEKSKEPTIEELIAKADVKRRAQLTSRRGRG